MKDIDRFRSEKNKNVYMFLFCAFISFVCITINSQNSFLYKVQYCDDMHYFMTTARCMLRGDVLYRDVYEHKGLYLYALYVLARLISAKSFIGVYLIELVSFAAFLLFSLKTLRIFCKNDIFNISVLALIAVRTTSVNSFRGGGEPEELALPFLAAAVYIVIRQCKRLAGKKVLEGNSEDEINSRVNSLIKDGFLVGICFGAVFWMKYTLTGAFVGMVVTVIIIGIKRRSFRFIGLNASGFILGMLTVSVPVFIYFAVNHSLSDLWDVYFYTLIFKYGSKDGNVFIKFLTQLVKMQKYYVVLPFALLAIVPLRRNRESSSKIDNIKMQCSDRGKKEMLCNNAEHVSKYGMFWEVKLAGILMIAFSVLGNAAGKVQSYTCMIQHAFSVLGFCALLCCIEYIIERGRKINGYISNMSVKPEEQVVVAKTDRLCLFFFRHYMQYKDEWNKKYKDKFTNKVVCIACGAIIAVYYMAMVYIPSPSRIFMKYDRSDYPICKMSEYMLEKSKSPKILYLNCSDHGLMNLTDTYPMGKYFGCYALYKPEELEYYEKYLSNGEAEFVLAVNEEIDLTQYGYSEVMIYDFTPFLLEGQYINFYFYVREDLV